MQDADDAGVQVRLAVVRINDHRAGGGQRHRQGVDGKIPAGQIIGDGAGPDLGQRAGVGVGFPSAGYQVHGGAGRGNRRRAEPPVHREFPADSRGQTARQLDGIAGHRHIQVIDGQVQQVIAHRPAHQVCGHTRGGGQLL